MNISYFRGTRDTQCKSIITIDDFIEGIRSGRWKAEVEAIQSCQDPNERKKLKKETASAVTVSGTFIHRKEDNLQKHSGFICIDFDDFDFSKYNDIIQDQYTYACFRSVSGLGLAVIVKISPAKHKESFDFLQGYYFNTYGTVIDPLPRNVASLRFVSYDTQIFVNKKSKTSLLMNETKRKVSNSIPVVYGDSEVGRMVQEAVTMGVNIAPDYKTYRDLAFAIANGFGEGGRQWFHALCRSDAKYNSQQADNQFDHAIKGKKRGVTVGTFYWMLKQAGVKLPSADVSAQNAVMVAKKENRSKDATVKQLMVINGIEKERAELIVEQVFERDDIDLRTMSKDPEKLVESLVFYIHSSWDIKKNVITGKYEDSRGVEITEEKFNSIFLRCRSAFGSNSVTWELVNTIIRSEETPEYNPIKDYIENNYYRNTRGNIDALCDSIVTDTPHYRLLMRKWLLCIAGAIDGKPVRSVMALVGGQNTGKTEFFRRLLPKLLKKYYAESKLDAGKDDDLLMCQKLIVMDDEMGGKSKQDEKRFKELTSKQVFSIRAPYARANQDFKRLAVLCGTSNDRDVINDPTGNTRIFPINIIKINHSKYNGIDKDELFMEIIKAYESGENYELTPEELEELSLVSEKHTSETLEQGAIDMFFRSQKEMPEMKTVLMSPTDIKCYIELKSTIKINNQKRFTQYLTKTFGESKSVRLNGKVMRVYEVVKLPNCTDQIISNPNDSGGDCPF